MKRFFIVFFFAVLFLGTVFVYTQIMLRIGSGQLPTMMPSEQLADLIVVDKAQRNLSLYDGDTLLKSYRISLGAQPIGHKGQEGDERTPEGAYVIDWRNPKSIAHLSLHISYPNELDRSVAAAKGVSAGGNIMIHGILNGWGWLGGLHRYFDWTNGCIAVTNSEIREIWSMVPNGTPIHIY